MRSPFARLVFPDAADAGDVAAAIHKYQARTVLALQVAFFLGASIGLILFHDTASVLVATSLSLVCSSASMVLALRGRLHPAAFLLAFQFMMLPFGLALTALGIYDSGMLIIPGGMFAMALVAPPRTVALFAALNILGGGIVLQATLNQSIGSPLPPAMLASAPVDGITSLIVLIFCGAAAVHISSLLADLMRALLGQQATLEARVQGRTAELSASNDELRHTLHTLDIARDELVRGEKLASLGSLVAGVAHELNTPIGNAAVAATTLQDQFNEFQQVLKEGQLRRSDLDRFVNTCREGNDLILRSLNRSRELVASFKQVAVDQASERRRYFDLAELLSDVLRTLRPGLKGGRWQISEHVPATIQCDGYPGPLGQVLTNLIMNAVLHGFEGRSEGHIEIKASPVDRTSVRIEVSDNGRGIPAGQLDKIFDPFFTTRLGQGGSGLGLTICHNIVTTLLGGRISVESTPGKGTCFALVIPLTAPEHAELPGDAPADS